MQDTGTAASAFFHRTGCAGAFTSQPGEGSRDEIRTAAYMLLLWRLTGLFHGVLQFSREKMQEIRDKILKNIEYTFCFLLLCRKFSIFFLWMPSLQNCKIQPFFAVLSWIWISYGRLVPRRRNGITDVEWRP